MKTIYVFALTSLIALGVGATAQAGNKYADLKAQTEGTKGVATAPSQAQHGNKHCREVMERKGRGGSIFSEATPANTGLPKEYRYQD